MLELLKRLYAGVHTLAGAVMQHGVSAPLRQVGNAIENYKGIRRTLVAWAVSLITWVTWRVFTVPEKITAEEAAAYAAATGVLTVVLGLSQIGRSREDLNTGGN